MLKYVSALILLASVSLTGCAQIKAYTVGAGNSTSYSSDAYKKSSLTFVGVPTILGISYSGSEFPVTEHYSITAAHVAHYTFNHVQAYDKDCDLALIRHDNKGEALPTLKDLDIDDMVYGRKLKVINYGYSYITDAPISSTGHIAAPLYNLQRIDKYATSNCVAVLSTAGAKSGMSGGPVYDNHGHVAGVIIAGVYNVHVKHEYKKGDNQHYADAGYSVYVPVSAFQNWLEKEINKTEDKGQLKLIRNKYYLPPEGVPMKPIFDGPADSTLDY